MKVRELVALLTSLEGQEESVVMVYRSGEEVMLKEIHDGDGLLVGNPPEPVVVLSYGR